MSTTLKEAFTGLAAEADYGGEATRRRVRWYQAVLRHAADHHAVTVNGNHNDPATREALRAFQRRVGVAPTGYLGPIRLNNALTQTGLEELYMTRFSTPLGAHDTTLDAWIKRFQGHYGLVSDGKVGAATQQTMTGVLFGELPRPVGLHHSKLGLVKALRRPATPAEAAPEAEVKIVPTKPIDNPHFIVGGIDSRKCNKDTTSAPYRYTCLIEARYRHTYKTSFKQGDFVLHAAGTGVMIGPRHVLTAAHVLKGLFVIAEESERLLDVVTERRQHVIDAFALRVTPGFNALHLKREKRRPFGSYSSTLWFMPRCWDPTRPLQLCSGPRCDETSGRILDRRQWRGMYPSGTSILNANADFALVILDREVSSGYWGQTAGFRIEAVEPINLHIDTARVHHVGYPGTRPGQSGACSVLRNRMQWHSSGTANIEHVPAEVAAYYATIDHGIDLLNEPNLLVLDVDIGKGQSGGPVWIRTTHVGNTVRKLTGIMGYGNKEYPLKYDQPAAHFAEAIALTQEVLCQIAAWAPNTFRFANGALTVKSV